jgi:hypothetical protein
MSPVMQFSVEPYGDRDLEAEQPGENQQVDSAALRILAAWIARRAGRDPAIGATVDRDFVVVPSHH